MRTLVTGATGFVGSHLCCYLLGEGDSVAALDVAGSGKLAPAVQIHQIDLRDAQAVRRVVETVQPEVIYHLAGVASIGASRSDPRLAFEINVRGTYNIFEASAGLPKIPRVLNVSTAHVYGSSSDVITEQGAVAPSSPYAASKAMSELVPSMFTNTDWVTVRPVNHSGPGQDIAFVLSSFACQIAEMEKGTVAPVLEVGDVDVERDFLDVRDVVRAYRLLARHGCRGEVYNVASGRSYSIASIIGMFRDETTLDFQVRPSEERQRRAQSLRISIDATKLQSLTGWVPEIPLQVTIRDLLSFWRAKHADVAAHTGRLA